MNIVKAATDTYWKRNNKSGWDSYNQYGELLHAANYDDARIGQWLSNKVVKFCADDFKFQEKPKEKLYSWADMKVRKGWYARKAAVNSFKICSDGEGGLTYVDGDGEIEKAKAHLWSDDLFIAVDGVTVNLGSFKPLT